MNSNEDQQHLHLLSIFHYVVAAMAGLFACFPIFHFAVGIGLLVGGLTDPEEFGFMGLFGLFFAVIAGSIILFGWAFAVCLAIAGRYLALKKNYTFCLVMGGIECIFTPFGTVLGIFTIIVLMRPSVKQLFVSGAPASIGHTIADLLILSQPPCHLLHLLQNLPRLHEILHAIVVGL